MGIVLQSGCEEIPSMPLQIPAPLGPTTIPPPRENVVLPGLAFTSSSTGLIMPY